MSQKPSITDHIVKAVSLSRYISQYVSLDKKGTNFLGLCPFHSEKTPSFTVNDDKHFFYCFGCQQTGNIFQFVMKYHNFAFKEALEHIANYAGISLDAAVYRKMSKREQFVKQLKQFLQDVALCYHKALKTPNNPALSYLKNRVISSSSITTFLLGFAPSSNSFLSSKISLSEYGDGILSTSQLFFPGKSPTFSDYQDKFRYKVVFPIQNVSGEVIAFGFRTLAPDGIPKYINSSESAVFKKREVLYGLYQAKETIKTKKSIYVTEGYFDVIALHERGIKNTVATLGTSITSSHIESLVALTENIVFLFDGDSAGKKAAHKAILLCLKHDIAPSIIFCEPNKDPYDMAQIYKENTMSWLTEQTKSWEYFFIKEIETEASPVQKKKLSRKYLSELSAISPFLKQALETQIEEQFSQKSTPSFQRGGFSTKNKGQNPLPPIPFLSNEERGAQMEWTFLCLCLLCKEPLEKLRTEMLISGEFFRSTDSKKLFQFLTCSSSPFSIDLFLESLPESLKTSILEEQKKLISIENKEKALQDCYNNLLVLDLIEREKNLKSQIGHGAKSEDIQIYLRELQAVTKKRKDLEQKMKSF